VFFQSTNAPGASTSVQQQTLQGIELINGIAIEALNDLLKKRGKRPIVANPLVPDE
jgi:hypothetical protein